MASYTRMKLTGPDGLPPPESFSWLERKVDRSVPVPEPNLKSMASLLGEPHDPFHVVADALNEAGRRLRILVGAIGLYHDPAFLRPTASCWPARRSRNDGTGPR